MRTNPKIKALNWHITDRCNYRCRFCFAQKLGNELHDAKMIDSILTTIADKGIEKVNFAGGEPFLHSDIDIMFRKAKDLGMTVSVVSNGSLLNEGKIHALREIVDWVGLSVDSANEATELLLGRGPGHHVANIVNVSKAVQENGIMLKLNTVVTRANHSEMMSPLIEKISPDRWKAFQCLHIEGQNDVAHRRLSVTDDEFELFVQNHRKIILKGGNRPVFERCKDMIGSYLMLSPCGNLIQNYNGHYVMVPFQAFKDHEIDDLVDVGSFIRRGGEYDWSARNHSG